MPRLLDLILRSVAPPNIVRNAARGKLNIPAMEQLEILVHLCGDPELAHEARTALNAWDECEVVAICGRPDVPIGLAEFYLESGNFREPVVAALLQNDALEESFLVPFAARAPGESIPALVSAVRRRRSRALLAALRSNPEADAARNQVEDVVHELDAGEAAAFEELTAYEREHAEEIAAEAHKPFDLAVVSTDERDELAELLPLARGTTDPSSIDLKAIEPEQEKQLSTLQKIATLTVSARVQLAMRGTREERMILIREGVKVVALAVLESPKLSETEMEGFASMKNVQEIVLRGIASRRRFMKNYAVVRALASNPRSPLDVGLPLVKTLLVMDLKNLMRNKSVSELVRRVATKYFLEKSSSRGR